MKAVIDDLVDRVDALRAATSRSRTVLGIAGAPGAGKTTLARALVDALGGFPFAVQVPMDGFHLADVELARLGRSDRKGAPDTFDPGGYAALLRRVAAGETVWAPAFERELEQPLAQAIAVTADTRVVISEGNYLLLPDPQWHAVREQFDEVWFCRVPDDARRRWLVERHVRFGKSPEAARDWVLRVDEHNADLVGEHRDRADLIVDLDVID